MAMRRQFESIDVRFKPTRGGQEDVHVKSQNLKWRRYGERSKRQKLKLPALLTKFGRICFTRATEFIVIDKIGCSPSANWSVGELTGGNDIWVGIQINTTEYFLDPQGGQSPGLAGLASPYPESHIAQSSVGLQPDVYILPGQNWEILFTVGQMDFKEGVNPVLKGYVSYVLYDGTDAVIANRLLEMGVSVTPSNQDWYRRQLIQSRTGGGGGDPRPDDLDGPDTPPRPAQPAKPAETRQDRMETVIENGDADVQEGEEIA
jgi:hypothetical protein